ncbi:MAG TPA: hypothetical protein VFR65_06920 [Nitrososphaeraceae archaeon]|nr:hypothetical protein [Nitrososphaeraceae archaeon]
MVLIAIQKSSKSFIGLSLLLPAAIAPLIAPIDVPDIILNFIFLIF